VEWAAWAAWTTKPSRYKKALTDSRARKGSAVLLGELNWSRDRRTKIMGKDDIAKLRRLFDMFELREHAIAKSESGGSHLSSSFPQDAEDFLHSAEDAFELEKYGGALTDAKRAIHCEIDEVMACLGYPWKKTGLRKKLDTIKRCGFAAPRSFNA
jgi:hypothetical protein